MDEVCADLFKCCTEMQNLADTFHDGKILHDGISLCLVGCPNVGKSSLMNALLDKDRAIVSPIPGTTRDILEDHMRLNGLNIRLLDTAGVRSTEELIEQEGIRRTKESMNQADLILLVLDASRGMEETDRILLSEIPNHKSIIVWNKIDLNGAEKPELEYQHVVSISAKHKTGLDSLRKKIDEVIWIKGPPSKEEIVITNVRHKEALGKAIESCQQVIYGLNHEVSPEFVSMDMRQCLNELGKIIGTNITEDILSAIFSKFCIGK
jgi:tRNA modification GTPase